MHGIITMFKSRFSLLNVCGLMLLGAVTASAADIAPATTTATFSQAGFPVTNLVDLDPATSGWAVHTGVESIASTAFIETATHAGLVGGTELTFTLSHTDGNSQHSVGKFRLSATASEGTVGAGSAWATLKPNTITSTDPSTIFTINPDNTVLVSGSNPVSSTYTVTATAPAGLIGISGFRLEALEDPSLPTNGPGRSSNGNLVMTDFTAAADTRVALQQATSNFSQTNCCGDGGLLISKTINGISGYNVNGVSEGWGFDPAPATVNGAYETVTDVGFVGGTKLRFGIDHRMFANHNLANVKFYVTGDDRSTFADGVSNSGDPVGTATWTQVVPLRATSEGGALVSINSGNTITFGGTNPAFDTYTIEAISPISTVTGMRMEITGTKGRNSNGNAVVSEVTLDAAATQLVPLVNPTVTFQQGAPFVIANTINGNFHESNEGWGVFGGQNSNQAAVFQTASPLDDASTLTFTMIQALGSSHNIQRFRISATTDPNPTTVSGAAWTILNPGLFYLDNSSSYSVDANSIITVTGAADVDRYTILARNSLQGITGFRLEVFTGSNGNLGFAANGNFVLNEFVVEASPFLIPEPSSGTLLAVGVMLLARRRYRRNSGDFIG